MKLLDTTVAVDYLRGRDPAIKLLEQLIASDADVLASELVRFELLAGVRESELDAMESFLSALSWVPVDANIARAAGILARRYRRSHGRIDDVDYLIGATAVILGAELLTTNVRHFPMIEDLQPPY